MNQAKRIFVAGTNSSLINQMRMGLEWIQWETIIKSDSRIFIKPNFTFPFYKAGVTTSPAVIEALVKILKERTSKITIGESDGGINSWSAEEAFAGHDLPGIASRHGVNVINLSKDEREIVELPLKNSTVKVLLPKTLLRNTDVFITMPVPKIHSMTKVSLGLKNQWGCLPEAGIRFRYHNRFDEMIIHINSLLKTRIVVGDCTWMLTGNGPMFGEQIKSDMLVVSNDLGAFELSMLHLMGLEKWKIGHIEMARKMGIVPLSLDNVEFNSDWHQFRSDKFYLKRTIQNYFALAGFKSSFLSWVGRESIFSGPLHNILYAIKGNKLKEAMENKKVGKYGSNKRFDGGGY